MSGPITPFKSPKADRTVGPGECEGELHGKALFTSPVLNQVPTVRRLETVDESLPSVGQPGYDDLNGKSPTAALFATPSPIPARWKRPRQHCHGSSAGAIGCTSADAFGAGSAAPDGFNGADPLQQGSMWSSGKTQRDLFANSDGQVTPSTRRGVIDFGALVEEGLRVQQLEHERLGSAAVLSETESEEEHENTDSLNRRAEGPLRWPVSEEKRMELMMSPFCTPVGTKAGSAGAQDEMQAFLAWQKRASPALQSGAKSCVDG